jgi:hypothetical protein
MLTKEEVLNVLTKLPPTSGGIFTIRQVANGLGLSGLEVVPQIASVLKTIPQVKQAAIGAHAHLDGLWKFIS